MSGDTDDVDILSAQIADLSDQMEDLKGEVAMLNDAISGMRLVIDTIADDVAQLLLGNG
jgi:prefoldin subunit 5